MGSNGWEWLNNKYSSRLKTLYIELIDYSHFHSPSELGNLDKRFTGRSEVLSRLKLLLSDYETPAGAYLITGYRGAGKSSLVAHALAELSPMRGSKETRIARFARLLVLLTPFTLLGPLLESPFLYIPATLAMIAFASILWVRNRDALGLGALAKKPRFRERIRHNIVQSFVVRGDANPTKRQFVIFQDLFLTILIGYAASLAAVPQGGGIFRRAFFLLLFYSLLLLFNIAFTSHSALSGAGSNATQAHPRSWKSKWSRIRSTISNGKKRLKNYLRFSSRVPIKINLSQDNIQERDILRLISKNIETSYSQFLSSPKAHLPFRILKAVVVLAFTVTVLNLASLNRVLEGFVYDTHISCAFPSQGSFLLNRGTTDYHTLRNKLFLENRYSAEALLEELELAPKKVSLGRAADPHSFRHGFSASYLATTLRAVTTVAVHLDTLIQTLYYHFYANLPAGLRQARISGLFSASVEPQVPLVPATVNYGFLLCLILIWNLVPWLEQFSPNVATPSRVLRRLRDLNDMIEAQVTFEKGTMPLQANSLLTLSFGPRKSQSYKVLSERDIEKHLLEIFSLLRRNPPFTHRPEFIIIFDELDKIQPHTNFTLQEQDEVDRQTLSPPQTVSSFEIERERQQRILGLVSNLKHFFTTCPAKFIFIAGREMFDASLADVSDRHFFMGSVFNQVIHVPSFLSDNSDSRLPDITSLTEQYLCRFLLPKELWGQRPELKTYYKHLRETLIPGEGENEKRLREKIIYQLHNFITYVTYRSNGAPKKVTKTIERFLVKLDGSTQNLDTNPVVVGRSRQSFYLRLGYYDQYSFDIIAYIGSPLIFSLNRAIKDFGDKILVSSAFLLDHIYKFHGSGFSWRNLELLPEIVDINRAPQLRGLISSMMNFLSKHEVVQLGSGLYDFKFVRKVTEELAFLSKVSEYESAAFNFTLDESLALKRHFQRKLRLLLKSYVEYPNRANGHFVNSVSYVRMILGDLHFYDGDLDNAIIEYMEAVQILRQFTADQLRADLLILLVRNLLKLGLAFEKRRSYDSALISYSRVATLVYEHFCGAPGKKQQRDASDVSAFQSIHLIYQPIFAQLALAEKNPRGGITLLDIGKARKDFETILKAAIPEKRPLIEATFLNRLSDVLFFKNGPPLAERSKPFCYSEPALCIKNEKRVDLAKKGRHLPCQACQFSHLAMGKLLDPEILKGSAAWLPVKVAESLSLQSEPTPRVSIFLEMAGLLSDLGDIFLSCSFEDTIDLPFLKAALRSIGKGSQDIKTYASTFSAARGLLKAKPNKLEECLSYYIFSSILYRLMGNSSACAQELTKVLWILRTFLKKRLPAADYEGLLEVLKEPLMRVVIQENYRSHEATHRLEIERLKEILEREPATRWRHDLINLGRLSINASLAEALVLMEEIELSQKDPAKLVPFDPRNSPASMFHSVYSRIHNLRLRYHVNFHNIRALGLIPTDRDQKRFSLRNYFGPTTTSSPGSARELKEQVSENFRTGRPSSIADLSKGEPGGDVTMWTYVEFLICDSIYCSHEISRLMAIYGSSYLASHTLRASGHRALSFWCDIYYAYLHWLRDMEDSTDPDPSPAGDATAVRLEKHLCTLIGQAELVSLSPNYHADLSAIHFRSAKEVHSEGNAYFELLDKMYYLTDDFSDQLEHFCAALERFQLNSGWIENNIADLQSRIDKTRVFYSDSYRLGGSAWEEKEAPVRSSVTVPLGSGIGPAAPPQTR